MTSFDVDAAILEAREKTTHRYFPGIDEASLKPRDVRTMALLDLLIDSIRTDPESEVEPTSEREKARQKGQVLALNVLLHLGPTLGDCFEGNYNLERFRQGIDMVLEIIRIADETGRTVSEVAQEFRGENP